MAEHETKTDRVIEHLSEIEIVAEDILSDKQQIIDFDHRRNKTREALRILQKDRQKKKSWICVGNMFVKMPHVTTVQMLEKDFSELEKEITETRKTLQPKVNQLRNLQNEENIKGFNLQPLTRDEIRAVERIL